MYDLRSDVLAPLSKAVVDRIVSAATSRPVFDREEDQEVRTLERRISELFGFDDALFLPTGTLANQIAVRHWCRAGEIVIAERESHVATSEVTAMSGLNGVTLRVVDGERGHISPIGLGRYLGLRHGSARERRPRLVWLENTHNRAGGTVMPGRWLEELGVMCRDNSLELHIDGARLWNAAVASGVPLQEIARGASTVMVGLNKIVGAPIGAVLLGKRETIEEATRIQKMFGGLIRPISIFAAAAAAALIDYKSRVSRSHECAAVLSNYLWRTLGADICDGKPDTNIVMLRFGSETVVDQIVARLQEDGIRVAPYVGGKLRCVLHSGLSLSDSRAAAGFIEKAAAGVLPLNVRGCLHAEP